MLTLDVNGKTGSYSLNLPTSLNEIDEKYINDVTEHIVVDANYSLIGIVYRERLSTLALASRKNNKTSNIPVIPIFVKAGECDSKFIKSLWIRDKLIISPSDIMLGHHVSAPRNLITINTILDIIDGDTYTYNKLFNVKEECYFIEFKLVPNCNIHGAYKNLEIASFVSPFVTKISSETNNTKSNIIV